MKFSEHWLREFVDPPLTSEQLAHELTMAGLEVEALELAAPPFSGVVIAEVLAVDKHPGADKLKVCRVRTGESEQRQIVCGAPNVAAGQRVPCALPGAQLAGIEILEAKVRGVDSAGMLCSAKELGIAEDASGLLALPADAPVGADIREYMDLDDRLLTLKLTPNRSDCLSVMGVAREVAAISATNLELPEVTAVPPAIDDTLPIEVEAPADCPLYCGRIVRGVNVLAPTPEWMVVRLERCGLRSISATVDVTNYVMLEMGQPLHAFDLGKLAGGIRVRFAAAGECLRLLNDQSPALEPDMLVIADREKPVALAGIMGGADSAVSDATRDLFLESAFFRPQTIAGRCRRLGFATDSAHRFERGVDYGGARAAIERATQLILAICGGSPGPVSEARGALPKREPIELRASRAVRVLGVELAEEQIMSLLRRLQFSFACERGVFHVIPPTYRFDLAIEEDLIEELARLHGYDRIPAIPPHATTRILARPEAERGAAAIRRMLVARDYQEVVTYSFVEEAWEADFAANGEPVRLANPIASHLSVMRSTLIGGLVDALRFNLNRRQPRVRIFETGRCFLSGADGYGQPERVAGLAYGGRVPEQWGTGSDRVDFFDAKGDVEALFWPVVPRFEPAAHPALHPGRSARVLVDGQPAGWVGELHPRWQIRYELPTAPVLFELELDALSRRPVPAASEVSRFPPVRRDLAFLIDESVSVQTVLAVLNDEKLPAVMDVALFDLYRGKGVADGEKSLAFRVLLQDTQKTLTDAEVESAVAQLVRAMENRFQAKLRD